MSRIDFEIDGDDWSARVRDESIILVEVANGGEIGMGGFDLEDRVLATVPALKDTTVEDARATTPRLFTGMTGPRGVSRGHERQATRRSFDVNLWDSNALLDGIILTGSDCNRPAETDYARVTWLITKLAAHGIAAGVVPNTNTVNMDAVDYREDPLPRRVLSDCGEAAQKNYFLYDEGAGPLVYYDKHTGTSLTSSLTLSSVAADVDYETCWPVDFEPTLDLDPSDIYSEGRFKYEGGHVDLEDSDIGLTTSTDFRPRAVFIQDSTVKSATKATNKLTKYLTAASTEKREFHCSVTLPAELVNEIRGWSRIHIKVPHLKTTALDTSGFVWFRATRREVVETETEQGTSREWYTLRLDFADDVKLTSFHDARPPGDTDTGALDDTAVTLVRYQLQDEVGSGYFGPFAGGWDSVSPSFTFGTISAAVDGIVDGTPEGNIAWPYTDCGVGTGGVAGLSTREVWHRFTIDLSGGDVVGVRVTVAPFLTTGTGYTASPGGFLVGDETVVVGIHTGASSGGSEVTDKGQYTEVGRVGDGGGEVFIPASLLIDVTDGYCWIVLAPGWVISSDLFFCNSAAYHPWGYGKTGHDSNGSSIVSANAVTYSGTGWSPWLPAVGDVDGVNDTFDLPLWNGKGVPEVRVGSAVLAAGEYSFDASALQVTLYSPPPADMAGQVFARFKTG